eukprot:TRINITY_DN25034_c0_g1_i1.p1 TRINITY_DN25034_c0_g1~~TRINITY_DN25034_c0_g1_i1.p1  ORF type:complete len:286 (+),score=54.00 TRINITY_DN25034_c0_g1_i1:32-889(+)
MPKDSPSIAQSCVISGAAAMFAEAVTIPLDTAKVRLQTQRQIAGEGLVKYRGPLQTISVIVKEQGALAPYRGVVAGCHRMFVFTGVRLGGLDRAKDALRAADGSLSLAREVSAALVTSAAAITLANPADVVKVRYQNTGGTQYSSVLRAYVQIATQEGVFSGLWKGYAANLTRNCTISAVELTGYSKAKQSLLGFGFRDGPAVHVAAGLTAGFLATALGSPADVVGTRLVATVGETGGLGAYCLNMLQTEGPLAFYKGFWPNFARIGSYNMVLWAAYEQLRKWLL